MSGGSSLRMLRAIQEQHWSVRTVTPRNRYAAYAATTSVMSCPLNWRNALRPCGRSLGRSRQFLFHFYFLTNAQQRKRDTILGIGENIMKKEKDNGHTKEKRNNAHFVGLVLHKFLPLRGSFSFPWTIILMPQQRCTTCSPGNDGK